jgi:CDP-glucose 4,6-dehydratase
VEKLVGATVTESRSSATTSSSDFGTGYSWQDKPVLVTGATGLLGSWMVRELQSRGAHVVALVRDRVPQAYLWTTARTDDLICVQGELEDYALIARTLNEYEVETVLHLGAQAIVSVANRNPLPTFETNIRGTYHVLEACRLAPTVKAVVVASSDKAYGTSDRLPSDETTPLDGRHPYDVSKSCADLISLSYYHTYKLPVCVTRCGNFYGAGDLNFNRIIPVSPALSARSYAGRRRSSDPTEPIYVTIFTFTTGRWPIYTLRS